MCKIRRNLNIRKDLIEKAEITAYENGLDFNAYISFLIANDGKNKFIPQIQAIQPLATIVDEEASYTEEDMNELDAMLDM